MNFISIEKIRFFGKHGFYDEEQTLGGYYELDLRLSTASMSSLQSYMRNAMFRLCREEMAKPTRLIEHLAERIALRIKDLYPMLSVRVHIKKINPPLGNAEVACAIFQREDDGKTLPMLGLEGIRIAAAEGESADTLGISAAYWLVDVYVRANMAATKTDELGDTINYETLCQICQIVGKTSATPEYFLDACKSSILRHFAHIGWLKIKLTRQFSEMEHSNALEVFETEEQFVGNCGRCKQAMPCYKSESCWCKHLDIPHKTQEHIQNMYKGCICKNCLTYFIG